MKVKELIEELQKVKDQNRTIEIIVGNEDEDVYTTTNIDIHHALDNDEQTLELFGYIEGL